MHHACPEQLESRRYMRKFTIYGSHVSGQSHSQAATPSRPGLGGVACMGGSEEDVVKMEWALTATVDPFLPAPRSTRITLKLLKSAMAPAVVPNTVGRQRSDRPQPGT